MLPAEPCSVLGLSFLFVRAWGGVLSCHSECRFVPRFAAVLEPWASLSQPLQRVPLPLLMGAAIWVFGRDSTNPPAFIPTPHGPSTALGTSTCSAFGVSAVQFSLFFTDFFDSPATPSPCRVSFQRPSLHWGSAGPFASCLLKRGRPLFLLLSPPCLLCPCGPTRHVYSFAVISVVWGGGEGELDFILLCSTWRPLAPVLFCFILLFF